MKELKTEIYNGADDDGSGSVALLEIAEAFQAAVEAETDQNVPSFPCFRRRERFVGQTLLYR